MIQKNFDFLFMTIKDVLNKDELTRQGIIPGRGVLVRTQNCLGPHHDELIAVLLTYSTPELRRTPGLGPGCFDFLERIVRANGFRLAEFYNLGKRAYDLNNPEKLKAFIIENYLEAFGNEVKVTPGNLDGQTSISFLLPLAAFKELGIRSEFTERALKDPNLQDAVVRLIAGFALAAQNKEKTIRPEPATTPTPPL